jgi:adenosylmethionine-8-amino-7-oxononanoate aminotransferase
MTGDPEREDPVPGIAMDLGRQPEVEPESLLSRDRRVLWHPLTQHGLETEPLAIVGARGAHLELESGRRVIDGISSWWCCLLGHGREELIDAMAEQGKRLDHVLLAGATHEPAVALAEKLLEVAPRGLSRVFYSDDGSTAVEVALKMARQFHVHRGEPGRATFLAFEGGYHGDTVGAMSVSDPEPYFTAFAPLLFAVTRLPLELEVVARTLRERHREIAGVVIEPLVQGAAGMRMHDPNTAFRSSPTR